VRLAAEDPFRHAGSRRREVLAALLRAGVGRANHGRIIVVTLNGVNAVRLARAIPTPAKLV
jgi:hypothetical protein